MDLPCMGLPPPATPAPSAITNVKRRVLKLSLFLLAGAIINVAVAWGVALWTDPTKRPGDIASSMLSDTDFGEIARVDATGYVLINFSRSHHSAGSGKALPNVARVDIKSELPAWSGLRRPHAEYVRASIDHDGVSEHRQVLASGWPCLGLWRSMFWTVLQALQNVIFYRGLQGGFSTSLSPWQGLIERVAPMRPIWPGFALNTLIYATALWLAVAGPALVRRQLRRMRGRCPACGYPVGS